MTQDGENLTKANHWSWDNTDKKITVLASYLTTLSAATYTFVATGNSGVAEDKVTFTITVPESE